MLKLGADHKTQAEVNTEIDGVILSSTYTRE
jgi:hypothetical protein